MTALDGHACSSKSGASYKSVVLSGITNYLWLQYRSALGDPLHILGRGMPSTIMPPMPVSAPA